MKVSEAMTRDVRVASPDETIRQAARTMASLDAGVLPVGENDHLIGMITDRDIAIRGIAKGKGFAGQHKRHHFGRGPVTHGSHNIKQPGSIGSSSTPSRVYKGMRMAGHLGSSQRTTRNLQVVRVDLERNLLLVNGDVPGHPDSVVLIRDARTRRSKA